VLGDTDGKVETALKYRVYTSDYNKLVQCWAKKATLIRNINNCLCADFDHKLETALNYRVYSSDYSKLVAGWAKKDTQMKQFGTCPQ